MTFFRNIKIENYGKPYIVAEIGANHNGDMNLAKKMIKKAKECGANAVKFQSWSDKSLIAREEYERNQVYTDSPKKHFGSLEEMVKKYYLRKEQHFELKEYCDKIGIEFSSTPFSKEEVDLLMELDVPYIKVASMDINNLELLKYISKQKKPIILSTGMATLGEIEKAVETIKDEGNTDIVLLHCISIYPPKMEDINLNNIITLRNAFNLPVGFSDHTIGTSIPIASIALGACVIEKHFTLDKNLPGWDHEVSADPNELKYICEEGEKVYKALGKFQRIVSDDEKNKIKKFRRSIVLKRDMNTGEIVKYDDLTFKRPGTGIKPDELQYVLGRKLNKNKSYDDLLKWEDLI